MARFLGLGNGADGVVNLSSYTVIKASCSGTSGATSLTATGSFSAGQRIFICQMRGTNVGKYEDNTVVSYGGGTITLVHPLENTYTDSGASQAQVVVVPQASGYSGTLTVPAWDGDVGGLVVLSCSGSFSAIVNGNGKGYRGATGVPGVVGGAAGNGNSGEGSVGASVAGSASSNGSGGGGGHGGAGDGGGGGAGGGYGAAGSAGGAGQNAGGQAGAATGDATISTIFMGGAGGSGGGESNNNDGPHTSGAGGNGGAIIVIYAREITSTAEIYTNGSDGGTFTGHTGVDSAGTGGSGAGGTILIKSVKVALGSSKVTASAGAVVTNAFTGGTGGIGSVGRIRVESCSLSGSATPSASASTGGHSYCGSIAYIF